MNIFELLAFIGSGAATLLVAWLFSKLFSSSPGSAGQRRVSETVSDDEYDNDNDGYLGAGYLGTGHLSTGYLSTGHGCSGYEDE